MRNICMTSLPAVLLKWCPSCETTKSLLDFYKHKNGKQGVQGWCKECQKSRYGLVVGAAKVSQAERIRLQRYNISKDLLLSYLEAGCLVCSSLENLHVHHDHACCPNGKSCGKCVVGVLCRNCNLIEGLAKGSSALLRLLADAIDQGILNMQNVSE